LPSLQISLYVIPIVPCCWYVHKTEQAQIIDILTNDSFFLSAQHILPAYAIWAVQKLENLNGR